MAEVSTTNYSFTTIFKTAFRVRRHTDHQGSNPGAKGGIASSPGDLRSPHSHIGRMLTFLLTPFKKKWMPLPKNREASHY
jgi:hypothetical protein